MVSAARTVYNTTELRENILRNVDCRSTLAGMLRCHKEATTSVARVLYREVHVSLVSKMSRANARRKIYCDSVRVLDASPRPLLEPANRLVAFSAEPKPKFPPIRFDSNIFRKQLAMWRKKFTRLQTVNYLFPSNPADDAYVVHVHEDKLVLELESRVEINICSPTPSPQQPLSLPATPAYDGMDVRHTLSLRLTYDKDYPNPYISGSNAKELWREHFYHNPNLDRRICSIENVLLGGQQIVPSIAEAIAFFEERKASKCAPITNFPLSHTYEELSMDQLRQVASLLGPSVRSISIGFWNMTSFDTWRSAIAELDRLLPNLQEIDPGLGNFSEAGRAPLSGMRNLRKVIVRTGHPSNHREVARFVCELGSKDCVYLAVDLANSKEMKRFNRIVKLARSSAY